MAELCRYCREPIDERQSLEQDGCCNGCWTGPAVAVPDEIRSRLADADAERAKR